MIQEKELRLGNLVTDGFIVYPIEVIDKESDICWDIIKPIPLTEDILLKCGFKELNIKPSDGINARYKKGKTVVEISRGNNFYTKNNIIEGFHDLQNQYYYQNNKQELDVTKILEDGDSL